VGSKAPAQKDDTTDVHKKVTLKLMQEKLRCIEQVAAEVNIFAGKLSVQISELKELLREFGGGRSIDTSTAGSQLMQDYQ
jgi:hypothetical protein